MGIKLIYYKIDNGVLTFGSEIRAILAAQKITAGCRSYGVESVFCVFPLYTPSPLTIFQGIRKLAPGTMLVAEKGQCREERWYKFIPTSLFRLPRKKEEAACELLELYRGAVKRQSAERRSSRRTPERRS